MVITSRLTRLLGPSYKVLPLSPVACFFLPSYRASFLPPYPSSMAMVIFFFIAVLMVVALIGLLFWFFFLSES